MSEDPVVPALRAALDSSDQPAIRVALGQHLMRLERAAEALAEHEAALLLDPRHADALAGAAAACHALNDPGRATAYELAAGALAGQPLAPARLPADDAPWTARHDPAPADGPRLRVVDDHHDDLGLDVEQPVLKLSDVGGLDDVKKRLD